MTSQDLKEKSTALMKREGFEDPDDRAVCENMRSLSDRLNTLSRSGIDMSRCSASVEASIGLTNPMEPTLDYRLTYQPTGKELVKENHQGFWLCDPQILFAGSYVDRVFGLASVLARKADLDLMRTAKSCIEDVCARNEEKPGEYNFSVKYAARPRLMLRMSFSGEQYDSQSETGSDVRITFHPEYRESTQQLRMAIDCSQSRPGDRNTVLEWTEHRPPRPIPSDSKRRPARPSSEWQRCPESARREAWEDNLFTSEKKEYKVEPTPTALRLDAPSESSLRPDDLSDAEFEWVVRSYENEMRGRSSR